MTDPRGLGEPSTRNLFDYPKSALVTLLVQGRKDRLTGKK
jgi:hypothetical protein